MVKIKKYFKYFAFVAPMMFLLPGCEKQNGPFETDLEIITDFHNNNIQDSCNWKNYKIDLIFEGTKVLECGNFYDPNDKEYFIKEINVITKYKYNNKYPSNSKINEITNINICYSGYYSGFGGLGTHCYEIGCICSIKNEGFKSSYYLTLDEPPSQTGYYAFIVEIDNGAGEILKDTTETVYLLKD